jgi:hypothetical protein
MISCKEYFLYILHIMQDISNLQMKDYDQILRFKAFIKVIKKTVKKLIIFKIYFFARYRYIIIVSLAG